MGAALQRQRHPHRRQQPERERETTGEQIGRGRRPEPDGCEPRILAEVTAPAMLEQGRRPDAASPATTCGVSSAAIGGNSTL